MPITTQKSGISASMKNSKKISTKGPAASSPAAPIDLSKRVCWNAVPAAPGRPSLTNEEAQRQAPGNDSVLTTLAADQLKSLEEQIICQNMEHEHRDQLLNKVMGVVIVLNALMMGVELDYGPRDPKTPLQDRLFWFICESLFIAIFLVEMIIRVYWERTKWAHSWWNWLDFIVVAVAVVETWILTVVAEEDGNLQMLTLLRIIRLARLVRVVKLMRMFRSLYVTVMAFKHALSSMVNIVALMLAGIFLSAIFTTATIGRNEDLRKLQMGIATGEERFGSIPDSMYSLFELMTLEGWEFVGRPLVKAEPAFAIFLFTFIMVFTFGLLNMVVAMVVEKTIEQARLMDDVGKQESKDEFVHRLKAVFIESDLDQSGTITADEFYKALQENSKARDYLESVGIKTDRADVLFAALDADESQEVTLEELLQGCARIRGTGSTEWDIMAVQASVRTVQTQLHNVFGLLQEIRASPSEVATQSASALVCQQEASKHANTTSRNIDTRELENIAVESFNTIACSPKAATTSGGVYPSHCSDAEIGEHQELISRLEACVNTCTRKHEDMLASISVQVQRLLRATLEDKAVSALNTETIAQSELIRRLETETQARTRAFDEWRQQLQVAFPRNVSDDSVGIGRLTTEELGFAQPSPSLVSPCLSVDHINDADHVLELG